MTKKIKVEVDIDELCHFTPKQHLASEAVKRSKFVLYGGAMGGGKSYWLRWKLVRMLLAFAEQKFLHVTVGLFCESYRALEDRHLSKIKYEFPGWLGDYNQTDSTFTLKPEFGSGIIALRNLDDASKYQSSEFAVIAIDELTKNTEETFQFLRTRLRWVGVKDTRFIAATNPGGIGHNWVKRLWIDRIYPEYEQSKNEFLYVPAQVYDNPYLDPSYIKDLESQPERKRKAFLRGDWNIFEGQYFTEWDESRHVVARPFPIPPSWKKFRAYDHGRENPACCKWYALDYDGRVWVYRELYVQGKNVDQIAKMINDLSKDESYDYSVADPSIFARHGIVDEFGGQTIAESFMRYGVQFLPASNRRIDGWHLMHQYLYWEQERPPKLMYFPSCIHSIQTTPSLVHDDKVPEDLDTRGDDHAADCDRYLLMSLHERKTSPPLSEVERKLKRIREGQAPKPWERNFYLSN